MSLGGERQKGWRSALGSLAGRRSGRQPPAADRAVSSADTSWNDADRQPVKPEIDRVLDPWALEGQTDPTSAHPTPNDAHEESGFKRPRSDTPPSTDAAPGSGAESDPDAQSHEIPIGTAPISPDREGLVPAEVGHLEEAGDSDDRGTVKTAEENVIKALCETDDVATKEAVGDDITLREEVDPPQAADDSEDWDTPESAEQDLVEALGQTAEFPADDLEVDDSGRFLLDIDKEVSGIEVPTEPSPPHNPLI